MSEWKNEWTNQPTNQSTSIEKEWIMSEKNRNRPVKKFSVRTSWGIIITVLVDGSLKEGCGCLNIQKWTEFT